MSEGALSPEKVLRELAELWTATGGESRAESGAGVLRACTMTLIVVAEDGEDLPNLGETIAALMPEHPARAILVRVGESGRPLTERVYSQCWMPFGSRRQICCERIEIAVPETSLGDLPSLLEPLAAPDLPVVLWWRSSRLLERPEFPQLAAAASKTIVDSAGAPDPAAALRRIASLAGRGILIGDLSWTQLTRWREMLSRLFENREHLARLPEISAVKVAYAGARPQAFAWYMGAWVIEALAAIGAQAALRLSPDPGLAQRGIRVELSDGSFDVTLERRDERLSIRIGGLSHTTNLPRPSEYVLMREELGIVKRDPVFERTLAHAARLAESA